MSSVWDTVEGRFWEPHYKKGGNSGYGSVGETRAWRWTIIDRYVRVEDCCLVDVGCGDLSFWDGGGIELCGMPARECRNYVGIDISPTVIQRNRERYPNQRFINLRAEDFIPSLRAEVVFCMDLLPHIFRYELYSAILENICRYSEKWIFMRDWANVNVGEGRGEIDSHLGVFKEHRFEQVYQESNYGSKMWVFKNE